MWNIFTVLDVTLSVCFNAALLPPHKKSAANSVFYVPSDNINDQSLKCDEPKQEPDTIGSLLDPNYSHIVLKGSGGEVKLPADAGPVSTSGKNHQSFFFFFRFG